MNAQNNTIFGIDLGKNWFHIIEMNEKGFVISKKKLNRQKLKEFIINTPPTQVAFEACPGSQYWGRLFSNAGFTVKIIPAQFVKPYLKSNKNDFNDATAIAEASTRGTMRCVPLKSHEQLELQATHRVRERFITERTATINQMRALLLEYGIAIPHGRKVLERELPFILEDAENTLTHPIRLLIERLRIRWQYLDEQIDELTQLLNDAAKHSKLCELISTVPGIGPIVSTGIISAIGDATQFKSARDLSA